MWPLIMQFSLAYYYFIILGENILLSTLFSNTVSICSCLDVRDQFHIHKKLKAKINVYFNL
jgi:hypothetical protein